MSTKKEKLISLLKRHAGGEFNLLVSIHDALENNVELAATNSRLPLCQHAQSIYLNQLLKSGFLVDADEFLNLVKLFDPDHLNSWEMWFFLFVESREDILGSDNVSTWLHGIALHMTEMREQIEELNEYNEYLEDEVAELIGRVEILEKENQDLENEAAGLEQERDYLNDELSKRES